MAPAAITNLEANISRESTDSSIGFVAIAVLSVIFVSILLPASIIFCACCKKRQEPTDENLEMSTGDVQGPGSEGGSGGLSAPPEVLQSPTASLPTSKIERSNMRNKASLHLTSPGGNAASRYGHINRAHGDEGVPSLQLMTKLTPRSCNVRSRVDKPLEKSNVNKAPTDKTGVDKQNHMDNTRSKRTKRK